MMMSHSVKISIAGGVEKVVCRPKLMLFFFFLYIYHAFIVSRYKKLRAALAMERTKSINQKQAQRKPSHISDPPLRRRAGKPIAKTFTNKY